MVDVNISSDHIEEMARCVNGSADPSGTTADQWKSMLLHFGAHSARFRESIIIIIRAVSLRLRGTRQRVRSLPHKMELVFLILIFTFIFIYVFISIAHYYVNVIEIIYVYILFVN